MSAISTPAPTSPYTAPISRIADWIIRDDNTNAKVSWFIGRMGYPLALAQLWQDTDSSDATPITVEMNTQLKLGFTVIH